MIFSNNTRYLTFWAELDGYASFKCRSPFALNTATPLDVRFVVGKRSEQSFLFVSEFKKEIYAKQSWCCQLCEDLDNLHVNGSWIAPWTASDCSVNARSNERIKLVSHSVCRGSVHITRSRPMLDGFRVCASFLHMYKLQSFHFLLCLLQFRWRNGWNFMINKLCGIGEAQVQTISWKKGCSNRRATSFDNFIRVLLWMFVVCFDSCKRCAAFTVFALGGSAMRRMSLTAA